MSKKILGSLMIMFVVMFSGCSLSKKNLKEENKQLVEEINAVKENSEKYLKNESLFNFYNNITNNNVNSFVVVESQNRLTNKTVYSNGVIVAKNGFNYYILTDYNCLKQDGLVNYKVRDYRANVYRGEIARVYDGESFMVLLQVNVSGSDSDLRAIQGGAKTDLVAYISSLEQINKVQFTENIKTSTIYYNNTSYKGYSIDNVSVDNGSIMVNSNNELCAIYSSKYNSFIDIELIRTILAATYSLSF